MERGVAERTPCARERKLDVTKGELDILEKNAEARVRPRVTRLFVRLVVRPRVTRLFVRSTGIERRCAY